jgi:hypothetical protein
VALDMLAHHKANDCGHEVVGCSFVDMGCTARILRKDIEAHERDDSWKHNRLLLGKAKEQQQTALQQQQVIRHVRDAHDEQQKELEELKQELDEVKEAHGAVKQELEELKEVCGRLQPQVRYEVITLRVKHAVLTGMEPHMLARLYSEEKVVQGHTVVMYVELPNETVPFQNYYRVCLLVKIGPIPIKITYTFASELMHYDGNPRSAEKKDGEHTFTGVNEPYAVHLINKNRLASPGNPYIKDGYVTFKCTFKIVD